MGSGRAGECVKREAYCWGETNARTLNRAHHTTRATRTTPTPKKQGRDAEAAAGFVDEINLLNLLKGRPNIIQLVDAQVFAEEGLVYMVQVRSLRICDLRDLQMYRSEAC